jgi:hypothetical protein
MVVWGRPKGHRGSYRQWEEDGIAPQAAFEILSPGNRHGEMIRKFKFYEKYGVEEYYIYDPDNHFLEGWLRAGNVLQEITDTHGWVSPRLGIRFDMSGAELVIYRPDGQRFLTFVELMAEREEEQRRAETERQRAEAERQRAEAERRRAEEAEQRAQALAARLRELGVEPES